MLENDILTVFWFLEESGNKTFLGLLHESDDAFLDGILVLVQPAVDVVLDLHVSSELYFKISHAICRSVLSVDIQTKMNKQNVTSSGAQYERLYLRFQRSGRFQSVVRISRFCSASVCRSSLICRDGFRTAWPRMTCLTPWGTCTPPRGWIGCP